MIPVLVGLSHRTAPVEIREQVVFSEEAVPVALSRLRQEFGLPEALILSTCNRTEIIANGDEGRIAIEGIKQFLYSYHALQPLSLEQHLYSLLQRDAVLHVFRVASSLDSMVIGEPQILGQFKQAYSLAQQAGSIGSCLTNLIPRAFHVAKKVRTDTKVSSSAVSISSVAVELARKILGDLAGKSVLLLGAGKMSQLAARNLVQSGASSIYVANRSRERSLQLAHQVGGVSVDLEELDRYLVQCDIVLVSTSAKSFILDPVRVQRAIRDRRYAPLFIIDLGVPRNVDPQVNEIENVFLYDIDDLQWVLDANLKERKSEAQIAEEIVQKEAKEHLRRISSNGAGSLIAALRLRLEETCLAEIEKNRHQLAPEELARMEKILRKTAHQIAHPFIMEMKHPDQDPQRHLHNREMIKRVFGLDEDL